MQGWRERPRGRSALVAGRVLTLVLVIAAGGFFGWRAYEAGTPGGVVAGAAEHALEAGSADVAVGLVARPGDVLLAGRAEWAGGREAMALPSARRWRITNRVYGPPRDEEPFEPGMEYEWQDKPGAEPSSSKPARIIVPFFLKALSAARDVRPAGSGTVLGRSARHYTAVVPFEAARRLSADIPWAPGMTEELTYEEQFQDKTVHEIGIDAWIDDDGRLRRLDADLRTKRGPTPTRIRIEFRGFGGVPPITPPTPNRPIAW
ncbi:hypothetical protein ACIQUQ_27245 [Streptomyces sp. NPDC101118]|uniref:hypothetical protein n=1 Tax=Streptomyces sp. NPDC101118 TaxID=3366109 RepID=UPI003809A3ED